MIQRCFSVEIDPELRDEFEEKFHGIALPDTLNSNGCRSVEIYRPTKSNPNTYLMISEWDSIDALQSKFGAAWQEASIPEVMRKFEVSHTINHYEIW